MTPSRLSWCVILAACSPPARLVGAAPAGAAPRAFRIERADQLMHGPSAAASLGDYRLDNGRIAVIIDALTGKHGFAASGGNIVDVGRSHDNTDALNQTFLYLDDTFPRQGVWQSLEAEQSHDAASVVVRGYDINDKTLILEHEYRLQRGADSLLLRTTITNTGSQALANYELGDAMQWGKTEHFGPGIGDELSGKRTVLPWVAGTGDTVSYALFGKEALTAMSGSSWTDVVWKTVDLEPGTSASYERYLAVGNGDVASLLAEIARRRGEALSLVHGRVKSDDGSPVSGAEVWFEKHGPFAFARTDTQGLYAAPLPAGGYFLRVESRSARLPPQPIKVSGTMTRDFELIPGGHLRFHLREGGQPIAGKIAIYGMGDVPHPKLGPIYDGRGAGNVVLSGDGEGEVMLPVGHYKIFGCHGIEYDTDSFETTITARADIEHTFSLRHVVDTTGYLSGDFHQHAANSFDSAVSLTDRVLSNLAEGVEILVGTDHDFVTDYAPAVAAMHAEGRLVALSGDEATTHTIGHFMGFPMQVRPELPRNGAPETWNKTAGEIFAGLRADPLDKVVQVNHPRSGPTGYFDLLHLTFDQGRPVADPNFSGDFDAIEAMNGKRVEEAEQALHDWMAFTALGKRYTLTGNSDTHALVFQEAGYPRNFVRMNESLARFDRQAFTDAVKRKHAVIVSNGPFLELFADRAQVGDTLTTSADKVRVHYKVQAAPWVSVSSFELWSLGERIFTTPVKQSADVVRLEGDYLLPVKHSTWVLAMVHGDRALLPVLPTKNDKPVKPFAFTNPIYIERP